MWVSSAFPWAPVQSQTLGLTEDPFASVDLEPIGRKRGVTAKADEDFGNEYLGSCSGINEF